MSKTEKPKLTGLTPEQGGTYLPNPLVLRLSAIKMTDDQFLEFCSENGDLRFELTAKGELVVMPPVGSETGWREGKLVVRLGVWAERDGTGLAFGPSAGFTLPNGAIRAPDASWIVRSRWDVLSADEKAKYAPICPDFVIELRSPSDSLRIIQDKLEEYVENGSRLGWLIDPRQRCVYVYEPGQPMVRLDSPGILSGGTVLPGFELDLGEIW